MTTDPNETHAYLHALELQRGLCRATDAYYRFLDTHRAQLEGLPDFDVAYDEIANEYRDFGELTTFTDHPDHPEPQPRDRRRSR